MPEFDPSLIPPKIAEQKFNRPMPVDNPPGFTDGKSVAIPATALAGAAPFELFVPGPSLLRVDSISTNNGTTADPNLGSCRIYAHLDSGQQREVAALAAFGNYLFFPKRGKYLIGIERTSTVGTLLSFNCSVWFNVDPVLALAYCNSSCATSTESYALVLAPATITYLTGGLLRLASGATVVGGRAARLAGLIVSNSGANAAVISIGGDSAAGVGHPIAAGGTFAIDYNSIGLAGVELFSTAGTTLFVTASYRP